MAKRAGKVESGAVPLRDKTAQPAPLHVGDIDRICANCQHFEPPAGKSKIGECHNGISGKIKSGTRAIDGCGYGFYPSIKLFPLKAGPGGLR